MTQQAIPYCDHIHYECFVEKHYCKHLCKTLLYFVLSLMCLGIVAVFGFVAVVARLDGEIVGYILVLPGLAFIGCFGWMINSIKDCYSDLRKERKHIVCLNVQKNRMVINHVIWSFYRKKHTITPLSRVVTFAYYNNTKTEVKITMADEREFQSGIEIPIFEVKQMIMALQRCNPHIAIEEPVVNDAVVYNPHNEAANVSFNSSTSNTRIGDDNNKDSSLKMPVFDMDKVQHQYQVLSSSYDYVGGSPGHYSIHSYPTSSSSSSPSYHNTAELGMDTDHTIGNYSYSTNANMDRNSDRYSSGVEMHGLGQNSSSLPPYLVPSYVGRNEDEEK